MSLQLALTQLESLAEMLNERKREAEQYQAFRDTLKHINTKFALRGIQEGNRYLLRQDDVLQLVRKVFPSSNEFLPFSSLFEFETTPLISSVDLP